MMQSKGISLFAQMLQIFDRHQFAKIVQAYGGDKATKGFSTWDQFVSMLFCHLAKAQSLREICGGLKSCLGKLSHLGVTRSPTRSNLSYANSHRPWQMYEQIFGQLLDKVHNAWQGKRKFRFKNKLYSIDASVIDLCLSMFDWAKFRTTKGAVKLHLVLDHDGYLPCFALITEGIKHEVAALKEGILHAFSFAKGSIIAFDRAYNDYKLFAQWTRHEVYFVTRMKSNAKYRVVRRNAVPKGVTHILRDHLIRLTSVQAKEDCPHILRRIEVYDAEHDRVIVLLTNHLEFAASTIASIYKDRWEIEIFFKTIKQHLKIKTFVGTSPNAVRIQLWTALIAILLLKYLKMLSAYTQWSLSTLIALLRFNLFTYRDLYEWLKTPFSSPPHLLDDGQLWLPGLGQQST
ncbi:MAG: IS4 family transposase [Bacteroidota bacterium]